MSGFAAIPPALLGRKVSLQSHDIDRFAEFFPMWTGRLDQISAGRFQGKLEFLQGSMIRVFTARINQSILLEGHPEAGMFTLYPVTREHSQSLWQRRRLCEGSVVQNGPDMQIHHRTARNVTAEAMTLPMSEMEHFAQVVYRCDRWNISRSWVAIEAMPVRFEAFRRALYAVLAWGDTREGRGPCAEGTQIEQDCLIAAVNLIHPTADGYRRLNLPLPARSKMVLEAEEIMRARLREPIGAIDLCSMLNVSERTLRLAFKERYGIGPMVYYKMLRLNAVRQSLKRTPAVGVKPVAESWGFSHMGNFAADYRRAFGERPSETAPSVLHRD